MQDNRETDAPSGRTPPAVSGSQAEGQTQDDLPATPAEVDMLWMRLAQARPRKQQTDDTHSEEDGPEA